MVWQKYKIRVIQRKEKIITFATLKLIKMKQVYKAVFASIILMLFSVSCTKFGVAKSQIIKSEVTDGMNLDVEAVIIDDGGCDYFVEKGFCYSLFREPSLTDIYSVSIKVAESDTAMFFKTSVNLPIVDTFYYVRAYVKNNAGLSYSNQVKISTKIEDIETKNR